MTNFKNQEDPKIIPNLSSDHATNVVNNQKVEQSLKPFTTKISSSAFKETKVLHPQVSPIPDFTKMGQKEVQMPKPEYTEEKILPRPVSSSEKPLSIETPEKEMPNFTKGVTSPVMETNPTLDLFQNAKTKEEEIKMDEAPPVYSEKPKKKRKFPKWVVIGIIIELIVIAVIFVVKKINAREILECSNEEYNDYYGATIRNTKKFTFVDGKIVSLQDDFLYSFDDEKSYETFKENYANPLKEVIEGRSFVSNIDDNNNSYEEKTNYNYKKLRKKNTSTDAHNIVIETNNEDDSIFLLDYNIVDIKIIYESDYICR